MAAAPILSWEALSLQQGSGWLFRDLDIHIAPRDRLALIGRNGAGKTTLLRLIAGQICVHACMAGMRLAAPLLALREGHSAAAVGVLLALFALTQVFLALPAGRYADRHGLKRPVGYAVAVASAGAALALVFPVFPVLCLAALMTGGASGACDVN